MITVLVKVGWETQKANYIHTYIHASAATAGRTNVPSALHKCRHTHPTGNLPPATTAAGPHSLQRRLQRTLHSYIYLKTVYFIHNHRQARKRMTLPGSIDKDIVLLVLTVPYSFHGQPCARNHRITSRWPPLAAFKTNWTCFLHLWRLLSPLICCWSCCSVIHCSMGKFPSLAAVCKHCSLS